MFFSLSWYDTLSAAYLNGCRRRPEGRPPYVPLFEQIVGRGALTPPQAVGAGHVPPAAFPLQRVCRKAAGRACPAPTAAHPF